MLKLAAMKQGFSHLTNEMLDNIIEWWQRPPDKFERDLILPRLLEERLTRMEADYAQYISREDYLTFLANQAQELKLGYELHNERKARKENTEKY